MAIWEQFPFTNFHEQNLDWVLNSVKNLDERVDTLENDGSVNKSYVDEQDAILDEKIVAERSARTTNDQLLQNQITAHTMSIGQLNDLVKSAETNIGTKEDVPNFESLWQVVGNYNSRQALGNKLLQVENVEKTNSQAIAGSGGTYDITKGTIQTRLNTIEGALEAGSIAKQVNAQVIKIPAGTKNGKITQIDYSRSPFDFAVANFEVSTNTTSLTNDFAIVFTTPQQPVGAKNTGVAIQAFCDGETTSNEIRVKIRLFTLVSGSSSDQYATVSYVDEKTRQLSDEIGNVEADAQEACTKAETADNNAASANNKATKAASDASSALKQIGSKSSAVSFANLWATIGAWAESVPMTQRIESAYNWSWNNRSAINGSADYPTDKASINARLTELESSSAKQKIVSGSTTVTVTTGKETVIDYADAGFTVVPQVIASYSTNDGNPTATGIIKIFNKTTTGCKITISSGATREYYPIDWIATGK